MIAQDLNAVAFPKLTDEQMAGLERCSAAMLKRFRDGEHLFQAGDRDFGFFVVKSGKVEIIDELGMCPRASPFTARETSRATLRIDRRSGSGERRGARGL